MTVTRTPLLVAVFTLCAAASVLRPSPATAQEVAPPGHESTLGIATNVVMPSTRSFRLMPGRAVIAIESVRAHVVIVDRTATTNLEVVVRNPGGAQEEAVVLLPVPDGGVVSGFHFEGASAEPTARLLRRDEARRIYDDIVRRARDPALLEFAGYNLIRSSVFPVPAGGTQTVRLRYEQVLGGAGNRVDYALPRSESLDSNTPWTVTVGIRSKDGVSTVYSPSHELTTERKSEGHVNVTLGKDAATQPGTLRLSYLTGGGGLNASLFAYPDPAVGGGYFLMVAGLPEGMEEAQKTVRREVTLVIDRSGSMAGPKMDQVRAAALQVVEGLGDGEAFNLIDYGTTVEMLSDRPLLHTRENVLKAREYLERLRPTGGTNIHDALVEALRQKPVGDMLPLVLFLTDGLPTVGRTAEVQIRELVEKGNPHGRRVFTFGVGTDVNVPLLDRVAEITRGRSRYVLPADDVEVAVADVFQQLYGPVFAAPRLSALDADGKVTTTAVRELIPSALPDLFDGDQVVLLGQYTGEAPLHLRLEGQWLGHARTFDFTFEVASATTKNAFVPRLWASRRIACLVDQIRQDGADVPGVPRSGVNAVLSDPRHREVVDEIVRLSTQFGVLSEYTAFLATEGTDLSNWRELVAGCGFNLDQRAVRSRSGKKALNQGWNMESGKQQARLNVKNEYWDEDLNRVGVEGVVQMSDRAYFQRNGQWIDSRLISAEQKLTADREVAFGSPEYRALIDRLIDEHRQSVLAVKGAKLLLVGGERVLVHDPAPDGR